MSGSEPIDSTSPGRGTSGTGTSGTGTSGKAHTAGAFDVRVVIAGLIGVFGVVLVLMGLLDDTDAQLAKTGGVNANLWAGLVMVVVAAGFGAWARIRPIVVPAETDR